MHRIARLLVATLILLLAGAAGTAHAQAVEGTFLVRCDFDQAAQIDPIVSPGQVSAHPHVIHGAHGLTANSQLNDLLTGTSTCTLPGDTAGYWMPQGVSWNGQPVNSPFMEIYYRRAGAAKVQPFPMGLKHVQGNASNTSTQTYSMVYACRDSAPTSFQATIPVCQSPTSRIIATSYFSRCWNGEDLDNATHKTLGPCGPDFPIVVPQIQPSFTFGPELQGGRLSSDHAGAPAGTSGHTDFWNGWDPSVLQKVVDLCLNTARNCRVDPQNRRVYDVSAAGFPTVFTF